MKALLSLSSKISEKGNRFIIEALKQNGAQELVPSHGDILIYLYQNDKMTMKDIAEKIHRTKPTVTVLINKLEKLGYLKREASEKDNRSTLLVLTQKGKNFKPIFEKISNDLNNELYKNLSQEEANILEQILQKVIE